jgi:outer membrane receptor for ferrienterochelin and colicin
MRNLGRFLAALLLLLAAAPGRAQTLLGAVSGVVRDEQGGALPGATVTLTGKKGSRTFTSDSQGAFLFAAVEPGTYELKVELSGFRPAARDHVEVGVAAHATLDFALGVGGLTDTINVVGEAPVVDTRSSATDNALSQDILFNMPLDRRTFNVYNFAPGINDYSAYGGGADTANALLMDGVDTRDPEGGTDWSFFNYDIVEEIQIQGLGAPAEYGAFTGAIVNTVTKSGGNQYAGLFNVNYTTGGLASNNVTPQILSENPSLGGPTQIKSYLDLTGQLSGPIIQDKLFFFLSAQRFHKSEDPAGPTTNHDELSHRFNVKVNYSPSASDNVSLALDYDDYNVKGRASFLPGDLLANDQQTVNEDAPEVIWNLQWRHLFNPTTFLEAKYLGWWGYYYLDPINQQPSHFDGATGLYSGGAGFTNYLDRTRDEAHAALTHYAEGWGHHDLKFGVEIERSTVRDRYSYVPGGYYYDYNGVPQSTYTYSYDLQGRNERYSAYLQDSWRVSDRLTINPGVRYDGVRGYSPALGQTVFSTNSVAPRLGVAFDLTGKHTSVIRAFYGKYYEADLFTFYKGAVPGRSSGETLTPGTFQIISTTLNPTYAVDPNIQQPRVVDYNLAFEQAVGNDFRLQVTGIYRQNQQFISSVNTLARWAPTTVTNDFNGQPLGVFNWVNQDTAGGTGFLITNPQGFQYQDVNGNVLATANANRDYKGLQFVLSKRMTHRWQGQVSYVLSKASGTVDSAGASSYGQGRQFETPTLSAVNADGESSTSRRHEVKAYLSYQIPVVEVGVNAFYRYLSGDTYTPFERFSTSEIDFPHRVGREPFLAMPGSFRLDPLSELDVRFEKIFKINAHDRIGVYADVTNLFNASTVDQVNTRVPQQAVSYLDPTGALQTVNLKFGAPLEVIAPRQVTLGARWSF